MGVKISELTSATIVNASDVVPIVQSGTTKKATIDLVAHEVSNNLIYTTLEEDLALSTTAPSISDGFYYTGNYEISVSGGAGIGNNTLVYYQSSGYSSNPTFRVIGATGIYLSTEFVLSGGTWSWRNLLTTTSVSSSSNNTQIPTAKAVYDAMPKITYGTTDIGTGATLADGTFYFVYE